MQGGKQICFFVFFCVFFLQFQVWRFLWFSVFFLSNLHFFVFSLCFFFVFCLASVILFVCFLAIQCRLEKYEGCVDSVRLEVRLQPVQTISIYFKALFKSVTDGSLSKTGQWDFKCTFSLKGEGVCFQPQLMESLPLHGTRKPSNPQTLNPPPPGLLNDLL